jgi:ubiquitin C-terminal hydrolase
MMDFPKMIESQKVRKQVKLEYLPHVLVIHIGRFSFDFKSNTALKVSEPLVRWYQT